MESGVQSFDTSYIALVLPTTVYLEIELELVQVKDKVAPNKWTNIWQSSWSVLKSFSGHYKKRRVSQSLGLTCT